MDKFFLYARKSSEWDDRQVQSIPDQISVMTKKAENLKINITEIFKEEKSAKSPWRPVFDEMMKKIRKGEASWIITWKLDRLSRNPIDSWMLQYMLQTWELSIIITSDRDYMDTDSGLLFSVESWIWNQYILDLKKNVKRGLDYKTWAWMYCGMAPEGYLNNKEDASIIPDPERFELIRKIWDLMLTGNYTVRQIMHIANEDWWFRRRKKKKLWGNKLQLSWMYRMLNNVFYTWDFMWNGEIKKWIHKAMITYDEFYRVQDMLWEKWIHTCSYKKEFAYTWFIKCWECWSAITASQKIKKTLSTWETKTYIYYHCTKRRLGSENCSQRPIRLNNFEEQIDSLITSLEIVPEFKAWWLEILKQDFENAISLKETIKKELESSLDTSEKKLKNLTEALIWELIDKDEYVITKKQIKTDINNYQVKLDRLRADKDSSFEDTEKLFEFIVLARTKFNHWDLQTKKEVLRSMGLNWTLKDWKLHWIAYPWLQPIKKFNETYTSWKSPLELTKKGTSKGSAGAENTVFFKWSAAVKDVRKAILEHWEKIYLPEFVNNPIK